MKIFSSAFALLPTLLLLAVLPLRTLSASDGAGKPSPILIFPGLTGSQLEVKDHSDELLCQTIGYYKLWVDKTRLIWDLIADCMKRELELQWDAATNTYSNYPGVTIRAKDFGGMDGVEYLDKSYPYFHKFLDFFVKNHSYVKDISIRAAPYDWRLAADALENMGYFDRVKALVEEMYEANEQRKVTIVGHSMGGPVSNKFLTTVDQEWKDKHIHAYVTLAGAWSGGNSALQAIISGPSHILPSLGIFEPFLDTLLLPALRSMESIYWMMPRESVWGDTTLVSTPSKSYTAKDYQQMFADLGLENSYAMYSGVLAMSPSFPAPNVPTYCFYGVGIDTVKQTIYKEDFSGTPPNGKHPKILFGDGDGVVNVQSSEMCLSWKEMPSGFEVKTFPNVSHGGIVVNSKVFADIASIAQAN